MCVPVNNLLRLIKWYRGMKVTSLLSLSDEVWSELTQACTTLATNENT